MTDDDIDIGDEFSVYIDRKSKSGNLISRKSDRYHILDVTDHSPKPRERWVVVVSTKTEGGIYQLTPIRQEEVFTRRSPPPPQGDGSNPFKQASGGSNSLLRKKQ